MQLIFDPDPSARADETDRCVTKPVARQDLPDLYSRPRFRLPSMVTAGAAFLLASTAFYGAETMLPADYKPSHFIGGYDRQIAQARAEGEAAAKFEYDKKIKVYETAAVEWQEQCRAQLHTVNNYTQAVWQRAGVGYQLVADLQRQLVGSRLAVAQGSVGGELSVANLSTTLGYFAGLFDPESGQRAMEFAEAARQQALAKINEAAQGGVAISPQGWDTGLTRPEAFTASLRCDMPRTLLPAPARGGN